MQWLLVLAAFATGMLLPLQPGINATLRRHLDSAWLASLVSFTVGTLIIAAVVLVLRPGLPAAKSIAQAPWWAWVGGAIGATFVTASLVLAPKLGAVVLVGAVVCGQMVSSMLIDHTGAVGYEVNRVNTGRVLGVALLIAGLLVVQWSTPQRQPAAADGAAQQTPAAGDAADEETNEAGAAGRAGPAGDDGEAGDGGKRPRDRG
jgi:transporter family-2 protein